MQNITVEELKEQINSGKKVNLVDVREPAENSEFNIGGQLVPLGKIMSLQTEELDELKDEEIVLYCRSGNRSAQAAMMLEMAGFNHVLNLVGGMLEWQAKYGNVKP